MRFPQLLLASIILCYIKHKYQTAQLSLPDDLPSWCPYTEFCGEKDEGIKRSHRPEHGSNMMPCCSPCSCSRDCGRKRNCCTDEYDLYKLDETLGTICKKLLLYNDLPREQYYHIINKCPNRSELCSPQSDGDEENYNPVYSKKTGMIYYNEKCAECHQAHDVVHFKQLFNCEKKAISYFGSLFTPSGCTLQFIPPSDVDMSSEVCFPLIIDECIPRNGSDFSQELCDSFNASFNTMGLVKYRNVYCYLCRSKREMTPESLLKTFDFCLEYYSNKGLNDAPFAIMLNFKKNLWRGMADIQTSSHPKWCRTRDGKEECRRIFCPEGQVYHDGKCRMFGSRWYFNLLRINVRLSVPFGYEKCSVRHLPVHNGSESTQFYLERPGFEKFNISLYYDLDSDNVTIKTFLAMLMYEKVNVKPKTFIEKIKKSLHSVWKLHLIHKTFILMPKLDRYLRYDQMYHEARLYLSPIQFESQFDYSEMFRFIGGNVTVDLIESIKEAFFLTKLFFCNLLELYEHEINDVGIDILINNGSVSLTDGEHTWVETGTDRHTVRICLQDFPGFSISGGRLQTYNKQCIHMSLFLLVLNNIFYKK